MKIDPAIGIDLDHFQIFIAFLGILCDFEVIFMFMCLFEALKQLEKDWFPHLKPSLLCFLEEVAVLVLQLLALQSSPVELHLLLVAEMRGSFLFLFLLGDGRCDHGLFIDAIVVLPIFVDLCEGGGTLVRSLICSLSISETLSWAWPVLRSLTNFSLPWPYW